MKDTSQRPLALIDFDGGVDLTHEPERSGEADGAAEEKEPCAEHEHVAEVDDVGDRQVGLELAESAEYRNT